VGYYYGEGFVPLLVTSHYSNFPRAVYFPTSEHLQSEEENQS